MRHYEPTIPAVKRPAASRPGAGAAVVAGEERGEGSGPAEGAVEAGVADMAASQQVRGVKG